jgi:aarF domain-containing kinase
MVAFAENNKDEVVRIHFDELGAKTKYRRADIAYKYAAIYNDRFTPDLTEGRSLADMIDYLEKEDPIIQIPEDFIFSSRLTLLLRGMGNAFGLRIKMSSLWEEQARALLAKHSSGADGKKQ